MNLIKMSGITKVYENGVLANENVDFTLLGGEIHAIAGENGAGKSTIMKILYGLEKADGGRIEIRGETAIINSPLDAVKQKIGYVHQHFMIVNEFTVYENIFLGFEECTAGFLNRKKMREKAKALCEKYNMKLNVDCLCSQLSVGEAQKVEILKALSRGAEVVILDEPTAVLTPQESDDLFVQLRALKEKGCSIVIITHRLKEIKQLCDKVTVMRKGRTCGEYDVASVSEADISRLMVGGDVQLKIDKAPHIAGEDVLKVENLTIERANKTKALNNVSFSVKEGEIVCIAGVEGNGQREVIASVTGGNKRFSGKITILNTDVKKLNVKKIRALSVSHIPEDRMKSGANISASIYDNLISVNVDKENTAGFIHHKKLKEQARRLMSDFDVRADGLSLSIGTLSGGNIQKVIIARELGGNPKLIVADQPTRGVDVGAIEFIHKRIVQMRDCGCAILLVSADLGEVRNLADRILVFHKGEIYAHIKSPEEATEEQLGRYMLGVERQNINE